MQAKSIIKRQQFQRLSSTLANIANATLRPTVSETVIRNEGLFSEHVYFHGKPLIVAATTITAFAVVLVNRYLLILHRRVKLVLTRLHRIDAPRIRDEWLSSCCARFFISLLARAFAIGPSIDREWRREWDARERDISIRDTSGIYTSSCQIRVDNRFPGPGAEANEARSRRFISDVSCTVPNQANCYHSRANWYFWQAHHGGGTGCRSEEEKSSKQ